MRRLAIVAVIVLALAGVAADVAVRAGAATPAPPSMRLTRIADKDNLVGMAARPGSRTLYVIEQRGIVWSLRDGKLSSTPAVDLTGRVSQDGGERGLLGLAFSPNGKRLYVDYTDRAGDTQIDELTMRGRVADRSTRRTVLSVDQPQPNHNGGQLAFGPDGFLYIGLGDGGASGDSGPGHAPGGNGQSLGTLLGKILRVDPTASGGRPYTVPSDNPFVDKTGAKPEIWSYGLRNPWRFSFDKTTGDLWIGDVGQNQYEEIDLARARSGRDAGRGVNFGWNRLEGDHPYQGSDPGDDVLPVYEIPHDTGACAVVGGFVYRGTRIPRLAGSYLFSDNCDGTIRLLVPAGDDVTMVDTRLDASSVASFGQANDGTVYVVSISGGIYRLDPA